MSILWWHPLQYQQTREGQGDPDPPQRYLGFTKDQLPQESLHGGGGSIDDISKKELNFDNKFLLEA